MSTADHSVFARKLQSANAHLKKTDDFNAFIGDCINIGLQMAAAKHGHDYIQKADQIMTPIIRAGVDYTSHKISCPLDSRHSVDDFLSHVKSRVDMQITETLQPLSQFLSLVGY